MILHASELLAQGAAVREVVPPGADVEESVRQIISEVRAQGDAALVRLAEKFDKIRLRAESLQVTATEFEAARNETGKDFVELIRCLGKNIESFHRMSLPKEWRNEGNGMSFGQLVRPISRVGLYVPGGGAGYPSSLLMGAIPAKIAGVAEIIVCTPPSKNGAINPYVLVACQELGVAQVFKIGGVQAIAAMAFGTESVPRVDKIVGPGNKYVTCAKRLVYGYVDIDLIAGPSEVVVVADDSANPEWIAWDLLAQAEHDADALCMLVSTSLEVIEGVQQTIIRSGHGERLNRGQIKLVLARDLREAMDLSNNWAPEHLELHVREPFSWLPLVTNAGAVFLGRYAPVPIGDYGAGPNHVLPTGGTARFFSPLGVDSFVKKINFYYCDRLQFEKLAPATAKMAEIEGLLAHKRAIEIRTQAVDQR